MCAGSKGAARRSMMEGNSMRNSVAGLCIMLGALLSIPPAISQELTSGTLTGTVVDPAGRPLAGAIVIATSTFGTRTAETDAGGRFMLPFMRPASYQVRVEAPGGFKTIVQSDVVVSLNQRTNLEFTAEPGHVETVTVSARSPLVDPRSTGIGHNINYGEFANSVPLGRSFTDTYAIAPGVVSGLGSGRGNSSISGASGLENLYLIDGVNITNSGYGAIGTFNVVYGSLGTGVTSEFLDEVQVKSGGFEAEYGQALGGIINTIVKSGTNDFMGSASWYASPGALRSTDTPIALSTGNSNLVEQNVNDFAFSVGGPIAKDKLFYFFAYNPVITTTRVRANSMANPAHAAFTGGVTAPFDETGSPNAYAVDGPLAFPSAGGDLERERRSDNYAAKFSWILSPRHQMEFTFFGDPSTGERGPQRGDAPLNDQFATGGGESEIRFGAHNQAIKWNAVFTPDFFMEAHVARHDGQFRETSASDAWNYADIRNLDEFNRGANSYEPGGGPVPLASSPVTTLRGGVGFISNQDDETLQYSVKFTNVLGKHEIRYGAQYDDIEYREASNFTGPSFTIGLPISDPTFGDPVDADLNGFQDLIPLATQGGALVDVRNSVGADPLVAYDGANSFRVIRARIGPEPPATKAEEMSLFVQDTWSVHPRVSIKAGLRWTQESIEGAGSFTLPFGTQVINPFGVETRIFTQGTSSYTPGSYTFTGNWAPRLGVAWDVLGNGRSRAWFNAARYFQRVPGDVAARAFSNEIGVSLAQFDDRALTAQSTVGPTPFCDDGTGNLVVCERAFPVFLQGVEETGVVSGTRLPYEDELSAGYAFEITPDTALEVRAIYRTQGRVLEDVQVNSVEQIMNFYYGAAYGYPYDPFGGTPAQPYSADFPAAPFDSYELANPGTGQVPTGGVSGFPEPKREYKAIEAVFTKRFTDRWSLFATYRLSRLEGNYEGLYRNDNGQADPNYSTLYDFPNSPLMSGQFTSGVLPTDVQHVLRIYPSFTFGNRLRVGANLSWSSGVPITSLLAHPIYQNAGEIPGIDPVYGYWAFDGGGGLEVRNTTNLSSALTDPDAVNPGGVFLQSYTPVKRGNLGRSPSLATLDLHADFPFEFDKSRLSFFVDVFNVFDSQRATGFIDTLELRSAVADPDFGAVSGYQSPRSWRIGTRWEF
jgi:hypothetical protein